MLKYIERKSGYRHNGSAWIGRVKLSRSGRAIYFKGRALVPTHAQSEERFLQNRPRSIPWQGNPRRTSIVGHLAS